MQIESLNVCLACSVNEWYALYTVSPHTSVSSDLQEDMSRTEDLSTKLRTLTYEHERLLTMHRIAKEKAANAEREMNLHKTKLTYGNLTDSEPYNLTYLCSQCNCTDTTNHRIYP